MLFELSAKSIVKDNLERNNKGLLSVFKQPNFSKIKSTTKSCEFEATKYAVKLYHEIIIVIWQYSYFQHRVDTKMKCQSRVNFTAVFGQFLEQFLTMEQNLIVGGLQS